MATAQPARKQQERALKNPRTKANNAAELRARRIREFDLRVAGASYRRIADMFDLDLSTVRNDIEIMFRELMPIERLEEQRQLELDRLDRLRMGVWQRAANGDDKAIASYVRLSERFAKLAGLDSPVKLANADGGLLPEAPREVMLRLVAESLSVEERKALTVEGKAERAG